VLFWRCFGSCLVLLPSLSSHFLDLNLVWANGKFAERKEIKRLVAKTHPDNIASQKVCVKCGGKKGEVLKDDYERYVDQGVKSDVWLFYFDRPGVEVKEGRVEKGVEG
jgi:hypothetical protein